MRSKWEIIRRNAKLDNIGAFLLVPFYLLLAFFPPQIGKTFQIFPKGIQRK